MLVFGFVSIFVLMAKWYSYKDGQLITYRNEHVAIISDQAANGYYELIIPEVKNSDAGTYKCVATNSYGEVSCDGLLTIVGEYF